MIEDPERGEVRPALSADEWALNAVEEFPGTGYSVADNGALLVWSEGQCFLGNRRHALAALALHGQPFGPKRDWLHFLARARSGEALPVDVAEDVYAFVAALLPPEKP